MRYGILFIFLIIATVFTNGMQELKKEEVKKEFKNWSINNKPKDEWDDVDWLAKMMMSEVADSLDTESIYLVGATAINHTKMLNCSLLYALTKPKAFSGVNNESYHWWKAEPTSIHKKIAYDLVHNGVQKDVQNVFAFCNLSLLSGNIKDWFESFKVYKKIGDVTFFIYEKNDRFVQNK
jgi:hypothetical protein